ncbi:saccharopine dehydrogenase NADP-binding domain-containing protein [Streptomyces sp. MZ04]|uniref:saccharopine dehydrogenase NADP-binding domain-containing protein n=1 Tax=Streptomyces sp. MZ04 TaxID=2559236 RepID=UPI00107E720A|nr:saccharopine dehydrogenase NADP-binding domain-containing protein [Streptomyces sp. MZ04]TGB14833.1 NAD-dependent epimerase/dehydratase family protein [Streptomyces sp. MZ04]
MTKSLFAIYGAYGHTGRLVASELLARGEELLLVGRDAEALRALADELDAGERVRTRTATVDDATALREVMTAADVVIHCAGPFAATGAPVAAAAAETGCHYIDHALEPHHVKGVFDTAQATAQRTGAVMIPGLSFYGGLGDLLAGAVADGIAGIDRIVIAYAVHGWRLTTGAKNTASHLFAETERLTFSDGALHAGYVEPRSAVFPFPPPLGPRTMIAPFPSIEVVTVPRHVPVRNVDLMLSNSAFETPDAFESEHIGAAERAGTDFTIAVQAIREGEGGGAAGQLTGHDLWRAGALASVEAAVRIAEGRGPTKTGVLAPGEAFAAEPFLRDLERLGAFTLTLDTGEKGRGAP